MMKKSLKQAVLRGIAFVLATQAGYALAAPTEGVEFSIRWDATSSLYRVYMRPVSTPAAPDITMSAQVTIRVPHAELPNQFTIPTSSITAAHSEWAWPITSKADAPPESPSFDYFSFTASVPNSAAREVGWQAGVEQEVFSFKNTGKCLGSIALINNDTDPIIGGVSNLNAGNEFSHRSWDAANDYIGNYGSVTAADCTASASTNSAPKAITDNASVISGGSVTVDALANDTDANNDALVLQHVTDGDFGKVVIKSGKLIYTADAAYVGADTFSYFVSDAKGGVTEGTVNVTVNSATAGTDTDGDGLTDTQEQSLGTNPAVADTDLDGVPDKVEVGADLTTPVDTDGDGKINALDADDDGDGIPTKGEDQNLDADKNPSTQPTDTDGDGKPNYLDADDDGDGKLTKSEDDNTDGDGNPQTNPRDTDGDGIPDPIDSNDNTATNAAPKAIADSASVVAGSSVTVDALANDTDADNDSLSIESVLEATHGSVSILSNKLVYTADTSYVGTDSFSYVVADGKGGKGTGIISITITANPSLADTDGDGLTDTQEQSLGTNPAVADTDLDGVPDKVEVGADLTTPVDTDGDGKINALDADDDGDGIPTKGEDQNLDADKNPSTQPTDTDGDGKPNYLDADDDGDGKLTKSEDDNTDGDGNPQTNPRDTDGDGIPDPIDSNDASSSGADDDGDGLTNAEEVKLGTNPNKVDTDGDTVPDAKEVGSDLAKPLDTDGDGIINALDQDDDSDGVFSIYEHYRGADVLNTDTDADGTPDYLDADDDGDGVATNKETADANKDGNPADAADVDKNGLPDYLDKSFVNTLTPTKVSVPTLSQWAQILLTMLLGLLAVRRFAKKD